MIQIVVNRLNKDKTQLTSKKETEMLFSNGGKWVRSWMKNTLKLRSPGYRKSGREFIWSIPESKSKEAVSEAIRLDPFVSVYQVHSRKVHCTPSCKNAVYDVCSCSCLGKYHKAGENVDAMTAVVPMPEIVELYIHREYLEMCTTYEHGKVSGRFLKGPNDTDSYYRLLDNFDTESLFIE